MKVYMSFITLLPPQTLYYHYQTCVQDAVVSRQQGGAAGLVQQAQQGSGKHQGLGPRCTAATGLSSLSVFL